MLKIQNLSKQYRKQAVLHDVSFTFERGTIYSIIGPNGAGKTTLLDCIGGLINPSDGKILLDGLPTWERMCKPGIGYAPDRSEIYPDLSIQSLMREADAIKYGGRNIEQSKKLLEVLSLASQCQNRFSECSFGMKKKTEIALAFLGWPKLILLDEPTDGVDTSGILSTKKLIKDAASTGSIVLVTSHVLDFVQDIAAVHLFLRNGRIDKVCGKTDDLEQIYSELYLEENDED
ncbi:MAG: ABC transporter ATP-binding protein [Chordicoccus sp.]